jgi:glucokinase
MLAGIDLGGTQVRVTVAEDSGRLIGTAKTRTGLLATPQAMALWAAKEAARMARGGRIKSAAIGAPGPIDIQRGVLVNPPNLPNWHNVPLAAEVSDAMGCPVHLDNDANLAAFGEYQQGAGKGTRVMVYLTWSTGIGGGVVIDGRLFSGAHGSACEIGHTIIDPDGPLDSCGQRGCLEAFAGGRNLQRQTGESAVELFQAAEAGDREARAIVQRAATYVGYGLINLANLFDPEVIVIGGGISRSWKLISPTLDQVLRASPFITPRRRPKLRRARLGDRAGQVGAVEWAKANS